MVNLSIVLDYFMRGSNNRLAFSLVSTSPLVWNVIVVVFDDFSNLFCVDCSDIAAPSSNQETGKQVESFADYSQKMAQVCVCVEGGGWFCTFWEI